MNRCEVGLSIALVAAVVVAGVCAIGWALEGRLLEDSDAQVKSCHETLKQVTDETTKTVKDALDLKAEAWSQRDSAMRNTDACLATVKSCRTLLDLDWAYGCRWRARDEQSGD